MLVKKKKKSEDNSSELNSTLQKPGGQEYLDLVKEILKNTQASIKKALELLEEKEVDKVLLLDSLKEAKNASEGVQAATTIGSQRIVEGVFNGEKMVGSDGQEYNVAANYASKSKLVEGDILKLTINKNGSFIYKQIGPIERQQLVAMLVKNESTSEWYAMADGKRWRLLTAAVTYFRGQSGDEVVILVPKNSKSKWAAVENIIKTNN